MTTNFDEALQSCINAIRDGQETIDSVVVRYPEFSEELRLQLRTVFWLFDHSEELGPRPGFVSASRNRLIQRINDEKPRATLSWKERFAQAWNVQRIAPVAFVAVLLLAMLVTGTIVSASQKALPGDSLYAVKRTLEQMALVTSLDQGNEAALQIQFVENRLSEVKALLVERRYTDVAQLVEDYEAQVQKTIDLIDAVSGNDAFLAQQLAMQLEAILSEQRSILMALSLDLPTSVFYSISQALDISQYAERLAGDYSKQPMDSVPTIIVPPTATRTLPPTPTRAPTQRPYPTHTPEPTIPPTDTPVPTNTPVPPTRTPTPSDTPKPTARPTETPTPTPSDTPTPTDTPTSTPTDTPTNTPTPTDTPIPTDTPTPTSSPDPNKSPTPTYTPTPTGVISQPT
jgi:Domain of unknown function (DUF5667)